MKKIYILLYLLIIIISLILIVSPINKNRKQLNIDSTEPSELEEFNYLETIHNFTTLHNLIILDEKGELINLKEIIDSDYTLLYRYFDINCQSCVLSTLHILNKDLPGFKYQIIASYRNNNDLLLFKRINDIQSNILNIKNEKLIKEIDDLEIPYLIIIDKNLKIHSLHLTSNNYKKRNEGYIKMVVNLFGDIGSQDM